MRTIIKDSCISPYEIHVDESNFTVGKPSINKKGEETFSPMKYYSDLVSCLTYIAKIETISASEKQDISQFIATFLEKLEIFKNTIKL